MIWVMSDANYEFLYLNYFLKADKFNLKMSTEVGYSCFNCYSLRYNIIKKNIKIENDNIYKIVGVKNNFEGMDIYWKFGFDSKNQSIKAKIKEFLSQFFLLFNSKKKVSKMLNEYISSAFKAINLKNINKDDAYYFLDLLMKVVKSYFQSLIL